jgi:hypothetical protein
MGGGEEGEEGEEEEGAAGEKAACHLVVVLWVRWEGREDDVEKGVMMMVRKGEGRHTTTTLSKSEGGIQATRCFQTSDRCLSVCLCM